VVAEVLLEDEKEELGETNGRRAAFMAGTLA
jgi:hypothetical protein